MDITEVTPISFICFSMASFNDILSFELKANSKKLIFPQTLSANIKQFSLFFFLFCQRCVELY